ncbi:MAG: restriction endonuclease subunit S [Oscillospiraceae bacterium]|nr:restriction endonuclease subunit S [Oscillospiraceae bacterium]
MYGATIGACSILPFDASTNQACAAFLPNDRVIPEYLYYFLCSKKEKFIQDGVGGAQPNISAGYLKKVEIEELSLNQQKQIAATLDKVTDLINKRKQQLEKLDELVKARFVEMFGGISDSKRYPYKAVKELTDVISGGTPSREVSEYWEGGTIPWVKTTELQNNIITEIDEYVTEAGLDNSSAKLVPAGTVLIAMYGQGKTRGMTGYLGVEACTNQACACILPSDSINQRFLWKFFVLSYDNLRDMAKGGNQPNLNGNIIKNYPVLCPPRELQEQFAAFVEKTDKSKQQIQQSLEKLETLKKSLMQEYFG